MKPTIRSTSFNESIPCVMLISAIIILVVPVLFGLDHFVDTFICDPLHLDFTLIPEVSINPWIECFYLLVLCPLALMTFGIACGSIAFSLRNGKKEHQLHDSDFSEPQ